jgi:RNA polymerase sigma-70 factor, ECF subfamily
MEDDALVPALARDPDGALADLVRAYQDRLFAFALRLTGNRQDAEEVAQDAFLRAHAALRRYPRERVEGLALRPWLYRIALNVARNKVRRRRPVAVPLDPGVGTGAAAWVDRDGDAAPEALALAAEQSAELAALVAGLPGRYRTAVVLRHVAGLPYGEVAAVLGQPVGTVKANVHRGVRLLRQRLEARQTDAGAGGAGGGVA